MSQATLTPVTKKPGLFNLGEVIPRIGDVIPLSGTYGLSVGFLPEYGQREDLRRTIEENCRESGTDPFNPCMGIQKCMDAREERNIREDILMLAKSLRPFRMKAKAVITCSDQRFPLAMVFGEDEPQQVLEMKHVFGHGMKSENQLVESPAPYEGWTTLHLHMNLTQFNKPPAELNPQKPDQRVTTTMWERSKGWVGMEILFTSIGLAKYYPGRPTVLIAEFPLLGK